MSSFPLDGCSSYYYHHQQQQQNQQQQQQQKMTFPYNSTSKSFIDENLTLLAQKQNNTNQQCVCGGKNNATNYNDIYKSSHMLTYDDTFKDQQNFTQQSQKSQQYYQLHHDQCESQQENTKFNNFDHVTLTYPSTSHQSILLPTITNVTTSRSVLPNVSSKSTREQNYAPISDTLLLALRRSQPNTR